MLITHYRIRRLSVLVDCNLSLDEMLAGCAFGRQNPYINAKNFTIVGKGEAEETIGLVNFDQRVYSSDIDEWLDKTGFESMRIEHHLALLRRYQNLDQDAPLVGRGSAWVRPNGSRHVIYTYQDDAHLLVDNLTEGGGWLESCTFGIIGPMR